MSEAALPLDAIRGAGWVVAVHNDYAQAGKHFTFWLFTKGDHFVKGEGESDSEALLKVLEAIDILERKRETKHPVRGSHEATEYFERECAVAEDYSERDLAEGGISPAGYGFDCGWQAACRFFNVGEIHGKLNA